MIGRDVVVLKFGGTSVKDAEAMRRVVAITLASSNVDTNPPAGLFPVVVTSACAGVTDALLGCAQNCGTGASGEALATVSTLRERHFAILDDLGGAADEVATTCTALGEMLDDLERLVRGVVLLGELTPRTIDSFASFGERLSSLLLGHAFRTAGVRAAVADSRRVVITDARHTEARPLMPEIDRRVGSELVPLLEDHDVIVAQGFIGSTLEGATTTIGRGGSDHSGAIYGAALGAREIQIWTDVSGILTADPRLVKAARVVPEVTFTEARELAWFGAKVLHPDTILPAMERNIPVVIRNSTRPDDPGTRILPDGTPIVPGLHSITMRRETLVLNLWPRYDSPESNGGHAAAGRLVEESISLFAQHNVPLLCAQLAASRAVAVVAEADFNDLLLADLESFCRVGLRRGITLLCLCGESLLSIPDALAAPLVALEGIGTAFIAAGSSDHVMLIGVEAEKAPEALLRIHRQLFEALP